MWYVYSYINHPFYNCDSRDIEDVDYEDITESTEDYEED